MKHPLNIIARFLIKIQVDFLEKGEKANQQISLFQWHQEKINEKIKLEFRNENKNGQFLNETYDEATNELNFKEKNKSNRFL